MTPTVVLHGFTGDAGTMEPITSRLAGPVDVPDLPGHGPGPHPADDSAYSIDAMADAVLARHAVPFHMVGYSMGGRIALTAACRHPEQVRSLSLIGASAGLLDPDERAARASSDDVLAAQIECDLEGFVDSWMANPLFATQARLGSDALAAARAQRLGNDPVALARSLRANSTGRMRPLHHDLARCTMPVALIAGADDEKFVAIARELAAALPSATVHVVEGAGHAAHLEQPDAVAAAILATQSRA